jgi:hypothetical protein
MGLLLLAALPLLAIVSVAVLTWLVPLLLVTGITAAADESR